MSSPCTTIRMERCALTAADARLLGRLSPPSGRTEGVSEMTDTVFLLLVLAVFALAAGAA
jgi:uncharacterized membrane protein